MSKQKAGLIKRDMSAFNVAFTVLAVIINGLFAFSFLNITKFSNINKGIFIGFNVLVLILLLLLNLVLIITIRTRKSALFNTLVALTVLLFGLGAYGTFAINKVNKNINKIVDSGNIEEKVETSLVVYSDTRSEERRVGKRV